MNDHRLTDDDIKALLAAVAQEQSLGHPDRDQLRDVVLTEFHTLTDPAQSEPADDQANVIEVEAGTSIPAGADGAANRFPRLVLAIAASLLVAVASAIWIQRSSTQAVETSSAGVPSLAAQGAAGGLALDPGRYSVDDVGGGIQLTLPQNVAVADAGPGFVELRPADNEWGSSLFIMQAEGSLEDLVDAYRSDGLITAIRSAGTTADGLVTEFEVRPTNSALSDECRLNSSCITIGITHFSHGDVNFARQLDGPGDQGVWTLYRSDTAYAPFVREANAILESIEFSTEP